ncbi:MAG: cysteine hydrolase [Crenarchaeota archaeon]|nr:cysteine hydrolase [Thermoproteota archaeon]MCR8455618.1 cysteine hydrolase [Thermoproteota archaeon]MCR8501444.1 cysteine hydrolase [Thermoproteota archaeon]
MMITVEVPEFKVVENVLLPASKTSLIIVDMQNDFVSSSGALYVKGAEKIIPRIQNLIRKAREKDVLIVFTMDTHRQDDFEFKVWPKHVIEGSWGWQIVDELKPREEDVIIRKMRYDAFFGTPLDHILRIRGIEYVVVCGVVANICVLHTAGTAALHGYKVVVPMDATVAITDFDYYAALRQIYFLYRGIITESDGIVFE